jgi:hypothetical protein
VAGDAEVDDLAVVGRQRGEQLVDRQPEVVQGLLVGRGGLVHGLVEGGAARRLPHVPLGGLVVGGHRPDLVQPDDQEQLPQLVAVRHVVLPGRGPAEEGAEHRLDDVLGVHAALQVRRGLRGGQGAELLRVPEVQLRRRVGIPAAEPAEQRRVGSRGAARR